jgi:hypothetical protein
MYFDGSLKLEGAGADWRQPFIDYIHEQKDPMDKNLAEQLIRRAKSYVLFGDKLYRRGATSGYS